MTGSADDDDYCWIVDGHHQSYCLGESTIAMKSVVKENALEARQ